LKQLAHVCPLLWSCGSRQKPVAEPGTEHEHDGSGVRYGLMHVFRSKGGKRPLSGGLGKSDGAAGGGGDGGVGGGGGGGEGGGGGGDGGGGGGAQNMGS
jgi:hypothetical protein